jgi:hypothetical protein
MKPEPMAALFGSTRFSKDEAGPGRTNGGRQTKTAWMNPSAQRGKGPARAGTQKPKITPKMKISDPNREDQEHPKLRIFSMEIQHGSYTTEVTALPPSF